MLKAFGAKPVGDERIVCEGKLVSTGQLAAPVKMLWDRAIASARR